MAKDVHPNAVLAVMCLCVILIIATVAAINISVPNIETSELHPSGTELLWIVDLYVIVFAGLLFPSGAIGDRYGRKGALIAGLGIYAGGSIAAALAPNIPLLLAARAAMGVGAAFIMPITLAVITHVFKGKERKRAISTWSACAAIGGGIGLLVGGAVSQYLNWEYLFWIGGVVGIATLALAAIYTPRTPTTSRPIDVPGGALLVLCFVALLYGIIQAPETGWLAWPNLAAFLLSALSMAGFIIFELRRKEPLLDPRLFRDPQLRSGALGIAASFFAMFSLYFVNAQFLQNSKGFSPLATGFAILPATASLFFFSQISHRFTEKFGTKSVLVAGMLIIAAGLFLLSLCGRETPYVFYAGALVIVAIGPGISNPSMSDAIMSSLPASKSGIGSAINDTTREVGSALGIAVIGTIVANNFPALIPPRVLDAVGMETAKASAADVIKKMQESGVTDQSSDLIAVREAFAASIHSGFRISAIVVIVVAAILFWWYPNKETKG
jgi:EmrB/QacA subfamily drug resistance transporter